MTTTPRTHAPAPPRKRRRLRVPRVLRTPLAILAITILAFWFIVIIFAGAIAPADPLAQAFTRLQPPSAEHWLGTDQLGRDVLSRVLYGARISIPVALLLVICAMIVGGTVGAIAGYFGKVVDEVLMRLADLVFAFPSIILAMVVAAALGPSLTNAAIAILLVSWPPYARVARSLVLQARNAEYVVAGQLLGNGPFRSLTRDILPNIAAPIVVLATLDIGTAVLHLAGLSFLGLGAVPPTPEWGAMISDGVRQFASWWIAAAPGVAIMSVVLACNLLGDALRDTLDPRTADQLEGSPL